MTSLDHVALSNLSQSADRTAELMAAYALGVAFSSPETAAQVREWSKVLRRSAEVVSALAEHQRCVAIPGSPE